MRGFISTEICSYCFGGHKSEIKMLAELVPAGVSEGQFTACLPSSFWMAAGSPWCPLAYRHLSQSLPCLHIIFSSVCHLPFSSFIWKLISFIAHPNTGWFHLEILNLYLQKSIFRIRSHSQVLGGHNFCRDWGQWRDEGWVGVRHPSTHHNLTVLILNFSPNFSILFFFCWSYQKIVHC